MSSYSTGPRVYRTEAIVLKGYSYGEADKILTLYTPHTGKLRAIAKGVRRTKSRMAGHLDLFTRSSLLVARGRQLDVITQAETIENYRPIRENLSRASYAGYAAELVDSFTEEQLANYPLYELFAATLRRLGTTANIDLVVRAFEVQLLGLTGYRPQLHHCVNCRTEIRPESNAFSVRLGGALCPDCVLVDSAAIPISVEALKVLRNLQTNEAAVLQISALAPDTQREVERRLLDYLSYRLEGRPKTLAFLERLRGETAALPGL